MPVSRYDLARTITLALLVAGCGGEEASPDSAPLNPPDIRLGESAQGVLTEADAEADAFVGRSRQDSWTFDLDSNQRVRIAVRADSLDAMVWLRGPGGAILATNDDADGLDPAITIRAPRAGRYVALVRSADSSGLGTYTLALEELSGTAADPGAFAKLTAGDSVVGMLESGDSLTPNTDTTVIRPGLVDYFELRAESAGLLVVDLISPHFDAWLALGEDDRTLVAADDGGEGTSARIIYRVLAGQSLRLAAASAGADGGNGRYHLVSRMATTGRVTPGESLYVQVGTVPRPDLQVCDGRPLVAAAAYDRTAQSIHPVAVVTRPFGYSGISIPEWAPAKLNRLELVLCLMRRDIVLQVCSYMGPSITRYRHRWTAQLREARTARVIAEAGTQGDAPRTCGYSEPYNLTELRGSMQSGSAAFEALRPQFARLINPADTTAPPPARAPAPRRAPRNPGGKDPRR